MSNKEKIIELIKKNEQQSIKQLSDTLDLSLSMVHRHIKQLLTDNILKKLGSSPHVFYILKQKKVKNTFTFTKSVQSIINKNFIFISPHGEKIEGVDGFVSWCEKRGFNSIKKADEYIKIYNKYSLLKKNSIISGKKKMIDTFGQNLCIDDVFYADFYAWEIFGKTKLGQLLLYAKQSQDRMMIKELVREIKPVVEKILETKKIDAIAFIPPTVKRQLQLMKVLEQYLDIILPTIKVVKIQTDIITPQKTLNKLQDRIENANYTMLVNKNNKYKNILLIDDAVGSGATFNQVACKLKKSKLKQSVYGFALTGSVKGFDVISEV
ncbi:winged helix-turn-helix transcriptional regulator [Candidatus Parcubacteria bacterium]|nr:winged helix-turn-helix transcriptional regulator [Candidatus Parcubacteria bacterium]